MNKIKIYKYQFFISGLKLPIFVSFFLFHTMAFSQCVMPLTFNCDTDPTKSDVIIDSPSNVEMIFDSFSEYNGGIVMYGSSIIKIKVASNPLPITPCQWKLVMYVLNGAWPIPAEWDNQAVYGTAGAGSNPQLDLLQVRVTNGCNTPLNSGMWQFFAPLTGSQIDIINSVALTPMGPCAPQVNGEGSYLQNYNEYTFIIDYRIKPGVVFQPGRYDLSIKFCLTEM